MIGLSQLFYNKGFDCLESFKNTADENDEWLQEVLNKVKGGFPRKVEKAFLVPKTPRAQKNLKRCPAPEEETEQQQQPNNITKKSSEMRRVSIVLQRLDTSDEGLRSKRKSSTNKKFKNSKKSKPSHVDVDNVVAVVNLEPAQNDKILNSSYDVVKKLSDDFKIINQPCVVLKPLNGKKMSSTPKPIPVIVLAQSEDNDNIDGGSINNENKTPNSIHRSVATIQLSKEKPKAYLPVVTCSPLVRRSTYVPRKSVQRVSTAVLKAESKRMSISQRRSTIMRLKTRSSMRFFNEEFEAEVPNFRLSPQKISSELTELKNEIVLKAATITTTASDSNQVEEVDQENSCMQLDSEHEDVHVEEQVDDDDGDDKATADKFNDKTFVKDPSTCDTPEIESKSADKEYSINNITNTTKSAERSQNTTNSSIISKTPSPKVLLTKGMQQNKQYLLRSGQTSSLKLNKLLSWSGSADFSLYSKSMRIRPSGQRSSGSIHRNNIVTGLTSLIQKNSPRNVTEDVLKKKKKKIQEKEMKVEILLKKRQMTLKKVMEEKKKKREQHRQKVKESRERQDKEIKNKLEEAIDKKIIQQEEANQKKHNTSAQEYKKNTEIVRLVKLKDKDIEQYMLAGKHLLENKKVEVPLAENDTLGYVKPKIVEKVLPVKEIKLPPPPVVKAETAGLNCTVTLSTSNLDTSGGYDMTPVRTHSKYLVPSKNPNNYDIGNLASDDSTDDESQPKKKIPSWAKGSLFLRNAIAQHLKNLDTDKIFPPEDLLLLPDLAAMFTTKRRRFFQRTSSAHWSSPPLKT